MQDQQNGTKVTLYLPQELHKQLKVRSALEGETMSNLAGKAIDFYLSHSDIVDNYSQQGNTHRVYNCPTCTDAVLLRQGELVSVKDMAAAVAASAPELSVEMAGVVSEGSRPEEGQLVHC